VDGRRGPEKPKDSSKLLGRKKRLFIERRNSKRVRRNRLSEEGKRMEVSRETTNPRCTITKRRGRQGADHECKVERVGGRGRETWQEKSSCERHVSTQQRGSWVKKEGLQAPRNSRTKSEEIRGGKKWPPQFEENRQQQRTSVKTTVRQRSRIRLGGV